MDVTNAEDKEDNIHHAIGVVGVFDEVIRHELRGLYLPRVIHGRIRWCGACGLYRRSELR